MALDHGQTTVIAQWVAAVGSNIGHENVTSHHLHMEEIILLDQLLKFKDVEVGLVQDLYSLWLW